MKRHLILACCSLLVLLPSISLAQITFEGCRDFRGLPVASIANPTINDIALATVAPNGMPVILYNPRVVPWFSPQTRRFFYAHECAHHALGHLARSYPLTREQEADCWGINALAAHNLLSNQDIAIIQNDIAKLGGGDWTHLPGPARAINLRACLQLAGSEESQEESQEDSWDKCYGRCEKRFDHCTDRCESAHNWSRCYDACQRTFDRCTDRCK
jgi:hypothetical protein